MSDDLKQAYDLDKALEDIQVMPKELADPTVATWWPDGFPWAVTTPDEGVVALFATEKAACFYRLMLVNQALNSGWEKAS